MKRLATIATLSSCLMTLSACENNPADGPPALRLGEDVCVRCNMIISDARWATATIVQGPRGPQARLFDDFNCQVRDEVDNAGQEVVTRWSHDHATSQWLPTHQATFLESPSLRTPMGSRVAAFATAQAASAAAEQTPGDIVPFETAWKRLGHTGVLCEHDLEQDSGAQ